MKNLSFILVFLLLTQNVLAQSKVDERGDQKVELQWAVCQQTAEKVARLFDFDLSSNEKEKISFMDLPEQGLSRLGLQIKIKYQDDAIKSTVKLSKEYQFDPSDYTSEKTKCEWDQYFNVIRKFSCSLNEETDMAAGRKVSQQQLLFAEKGIDATIDDRNLKEVGPFKLVTYKGNIKNIEEHVVVDALVLPSGQELTEISIRSSVKNLTKNFARMNDYLKEKNILLCPQQAGKYQRLIGQ